MAVTQTRSWIKDFTAQIAEFYQLATAEQIPIDDVEGIGPALMQTRVAYGLTQAQLAKRLGLAPSAINCYGANEYQFDRVRTPTQTVE